MAKILIISETLWYPSNYGDAIRQFHLLKHLRRIHDFTWCSRYRYKRIPGEQGSDYAKSESLLIGTPDFVTKVVKVIYYVLAGRPIGHAADYFMKVRDRIRNLTANERFDIVQIEHLRMAGYVKAIAPACNAIKLLTIQNVDHILYEQLANIERNPLKKIFKRIESKKCFKFEKDMLKNFDAFITVSEDNVQWLRSMGVQGPIHLSFNGADVAGTAFFEQRDSTVLIMPGTMDYEPNIDAAKYFVKEVLPMVWAKMPEIRLLIVGKNPSNDVKSLQSDARIKITGTVPAMGPYYEEAALTVVPLRSGSGTRLKIIESMAYGRVVVSTSIGVEGLQCKEGEHFLLANTPTEMAEAILKLVCGLKNREAIAGRARKHVEEHYDYKQIAAELDMFYRRLLVSRNSINVSAGKTAGRNS